MRFAAITAVFVAVGCGTILSIDADPGGGPDSGMPGIASDAGEGGTQLVLRADAGIFRIEVDDESVYFTSNSGWLLGRAPKSGGDVTLLLPEGGLKEPTAGLLTDGDYVYVSAYTAGGGSGVRRMPKAGGPAEAIDTCNTSWSIAVDATDVYWLTGHCGGDARLRRRAKEERDAAATVESLQESRSMYGYAHTGYTGLDVSDVYWSNKTQIKSLPKNGIAGAAPRTVSERTVGSDVFRALVVSDRIYVILGDRVLAITKETGAQTVLVDGAPNDSEAPASIRVADGAVYYTLPERGVVGRVPTKGGAAEILAHDQLSPVGLAIDGTHIYWSNAGDGSIWRMAR